MFPWARARARIILAVAVAAACALAISAPSQATATQPSAGTSTGAQSSGAAQQASLTERAESAASARARSSGARVTVDALTTPTSMVAANPSGTFTLTQSLQPTRTKRDGAWVNLDATLHRDADGTVSPNATENAVTLSGGGSSPLAVLTDAGYSLSIIWPAALPRPTLSGARADYANVLPGVDLEVTATDQGGLAEVLIVRNASAAADPALGTLRMRLRTKGITVSQDAEGNLTARAGAGGLPVFSAAAPIMWDSATNALPTPTSARATTVSSESGPGRAAHTAPVTGSLSPAPPTTRANQSVESDTTLALAPNRVMLTGKATVFPIYIDPTWNPLPSGGARQAWGSVSTLYPGNNEYDNSTDPDANILQVGNSSYYTARSFIRFGVSSVLSGATIFSSDVKFTSAGDVCKSSATEVDLYWTGPIRNPLTWNNMPAMSNKVASANGTDCPNTSVDFNVTTFMRAHVGATDMTFGLRAPDESDNAQWKEFLSNNGAASMSTEYKHAPSLPRLPSTSPGGICNTGSPSAVTIGNDDVTFSVIPNDVDGGQLGTQLVIKDYGSGTTVYDSGPAASAISALTTTSGSPQPIVIPRTKIQGWNPNGATQAYQYSWYVITSDGKLYNPTNGPGTSGQPCTFTYNPAQPSAPGVAVPSTIPDLGQSIAITLGPCAGSLATPPTACTGPAPTRYVYQLNESAPASVTAVTGAETVALPLHHAGANILTVYALSAGANPGSVTSTTFDVGIPGASYADGDINGDGNPDFLHNGAGGNAGLWLGTSDGHGNLATPIDIGALGTGASSTPSPAEWTGADILHGDFTGDHVQDIAAYYPTGTAAGNADLLFGNGDATALSPYAYAQQEITAPNLADTALNAAGDNPADLVAAGNATLAGNPVPDLIGIVGDATNGYQLDMYTSPDGRFGDYTYGQTIATPGQSPDGTNDWHNYTLAATQTPGMTVLFALNTLSGTLYESANPDQSTTTPIGSPGTWTAITQWQSAGNVAGLPVLVSADVTTAPGTPTIEIWTTDSSNATATDYFLTGGTLTAQHTTSLLAPGHSWPLSDGGNATTAADTSGATPATLEGGATWTTDPLLKRPVLALDGSTGYLGLPTGLVKSSDTLTISLSFKASPGTTGILVSTGNDVPANLNPATMPVMYIGTDGRLYAQFWNGSVRPMVSAAPVNDGQWHKATLASDGTNQSLFVDNDLRVGMAGSPPVTNEDPFNYIGAGVFPANTSTKSWINAPGNSTVARASYFTGQISDVSYYAAYLTPDEVTPFHNPQPITGAITSALSNALCIDDRSGNTADGNPIQIYTCNNSAAQQWTITPQPGGVLNTITTSGKCLTVAGSGTASGTGIDLYTCNGTPADYWTIDSDGQLWNPHSQMCLADPASTTIPGTQLIIYACDYGNEQNWHRP
ncbi:ricin-type beta-trefoil lectin domain protein [Catenulispora sp. EB89]|uniref:ricin-type beta-trefoil lectin domain protein n=1 Tax=Catenulispora sp. EB89 TaxID=3156257 RepID=UPI0035110843